MSAVSPHYFGFINLQSDWLFFNQTIVCGFTCIEETIVGHDVFPVFLSPFIMNKSHSLAGLIFDHKDTNVFFLCLHFMFSAISQSSFSFCHTWRTMYSKLIQKGLRRLVKHFVDRHPWMFANALVISLW